MTDMEYAGDIALVGIGCRFPQSAGPEAFWRNLRDGVCLVSFLSEEEKAA